MINQKGLENTQEHIQLMQDINIIPLQSYPKSYHQHWHRQIELMYYPMAAKSDHNPVFKINQTVFELQPGDTLFVWPGELHETIDNPESQIIGLQFPSNFLEELRDFVPYINLFRAHHHIEHWKRPQLASDVASRIDAILNTYDSDEPFANTKMLISLYEMFMDISLYLRDNFTHEMGEPVPEANKTFMRISEACRYIKENCSQLLTLQMIADHVGFSTYYFSRVFKSITNTSFLEYLTMQRIKKAQVLLADSSLSITEIAYMSGYSSISTFNRVFRKSRGCSPTEYRKYNK